MGIEGGSNNEVQNQEINQANNEQNELNQAEHQRSGEELEGNSTIDNEGERKQIEGKDDATESTEDESSQLDKEDTIEDDPNNEQSQETENVAPEQQLDDQDTIESDPSGADEMGDDNNETVDALDNDDEIEDSEDLDDNEDSTEDNMQDSLDSEDSIDSEDVDDSDDENDGNEQDPLDPEDSIEDDDSEEFDDSEDNEEAENPEDNEETESPEENEETENPEDNGETKDPDDEIEKSKYDNGDSSVKDPINDNSGLSDTNAFYSKADGSDGSDGSEDPEKLKGYNDIAEFNNDLNKLYSDPNLSNQEKVDAAKGCVDKLNNSDLSPEEKKQSIDVPSDARALKNPENSDWTERTDDNPWPPLNIDFPDKMGLDYSKDITPLGKDEGTSQLPDTGYRYGGEGGYNYTCKGEDGHVPSLDERALPKEYVPEKDREVHFDNDRYCDAIDAIRDYDSDPAASLNSINGMIDDIKAERGTDIQHLDADELEVLSDKYKQLQDTEFADVRDELEIDDKDFTAYGVHGHAKPMEDVDGDTICEGGANQFNTALPEYMLKRIGVEY